MSSKKNGNSRLSTKDKKLQAKVGKVHHGQLAKKPQNTGNHCIIDVFDKQRQTQKSNEEADWHNDTIIVEDTVQSPYVSPTKISPANNATSICDHDKQAQEIPIPKLTRVNLKRKCKSEIEIKTSEKTPTDCNKIQKSKSAPEYITKNENIKKKESVKNEEETIGNPKTICQSTESFSKDGLILSLDDSRADVKNEPTHKLELKTKRPRSNSIKSFVSPLHKKVKHDTEMKKMENELDLSSISVKYDTHDGPPRKESEEVLAKSTTERESSTCVKKTSNAPSKLMHSTDSNCDQNDNTPKVMASSSKSFVKSGKKKSVERSDSQDPQKGGEGSDDEVGDEKHGEEDTQEYRVPYYLENFKLVLQTVLEDEFYEPLFNEEDLDVVGRFHQLSGKNIFIYFYFFFR